MRLNGRRSSATLLSGASGAASSASGRDLRAGTRATRRAPWVVKIGGRLCEDAATRARLAAACAELGAPLVIVHGGGSEVTRLQRALALEPRFVEGRRVTGPEEMRLVEMALSGSINQALVRDLQVAGCSAVGVSGCDGAMLRCVRVPELGLVGEPARVAPRLLRILLAAGYVPVVSPVSLGPDGEALNVNADEAAGALAAALQADRLLLLSDVEGVQVEGAWQEEVAGSAVEALIAGGQATDGMVPKLRTAALATAQGVREVRIAGFGGGSLAAVQGTRVRA